MGIKRLKTKTIIQVIVTENFCTVLFFIRNTALYTFTQHLMMMMMMMMVMTTMIMLDDDDADDDDDDGPLYSVVTMTCRSPAK